MRMSKHCRSPQSNDAHRRFCTRSDGRVGAAGDAWHLRWLPNALLISWMSKPPSGHVWFMCFDHFRNCIFSSKSQKRPVGRWAHVLGWSFLPNAFWKWDFTKKVEPTIGPSIFILLTLTVSGFIKSLMRFWIRFFSRVSSLYKTSRNFCSPLLRKSGSAGYCKDTSALPFCKSSGRRTLINYFSRISGRSRWCCPVFIEFLSRCAR